jgi:pyruvate kinase
MDIAGPKVRIKQLLTTKRNSKVFAGDAFFLTDNKILQNFNEIGIVCGCSIPGIISNLKIGESVLVDDGKIEAHVEAVTENGVTVRVDKCLKKGVTLKTEKGLNFPGSTLSIGILTEKDKKDLKFICQNADIVGFSFVNTPEDIITCRNEIVNILGEERSRSCITCGKD